MNWFKKFWKALNTPAPSETPLSDFTPRAQQVLSLARMEANRLNHNFLGTEHVLLGLIKLGQGVAVNVLTKQGMDLETVRQEVEKQVGRGPDQKMIGNVPYTPRVKKAIALAQKEAKSLNHTYVGTEHILLGLLREGDGVAPKVLRALGLDLEKTRKEILNELDPNFDPDSADAAKDTTKESSEPQSKIPQNPFSKCKKPDPVDLAKRYDVYCIEHGQTVVYRNVLFKGVKGLLPLREYDALSAYIELELADGKAVFLPMYTVFKFCDPGADAGGERISSFKP